MIISPEVTEENLNKFLPELKAFFKDKCGSFPIEVYDKDLIPCMNKTIEELKLIAAAVLDNPTAQCSDIIKDRSKDISLDTELIDDTYKYCQPDEIEEQLSELKFIEACLVIDDLAARCFSFDYKIKIKELRFIAYSLVALSDKNGNNLDIIKRLVYMEYTGLVGDDETSWREALEHKTPTGVLSFSSLGQPNDLDSDNNEDSDIELKPCPKCKNRAALQRDKDTSGKKFGELIAQIKNAITVRTTEYNQEKILEQERREATREFAHNVAVDMLKDNYPLSAIIKISKLTEDAIINIAHNLNITIQ